MPIVGRLDQYASMLATEFDDYSMSENLISNSEFAYLQQSGSTVATSGQAFTPYRRSTAVRFNNNGGAGDTYIYLDFSTTFSSGTQYVISIFSNSSTLNLGQGGLATGKYTQISSGSVFISNGWYRHWVSYSATVNNPNITPQVTIAQGITVTLCGWQLELGSFITDYTLTTGTPINRVLSSTTNTNISSTGVYYSSGFDENTGFTTLLSANIFPPYDPIHDEFGGTLFGAGQGRYMRQYTDKSVIIYNEIDEITSFT